MKTDSVNFFLLYSVFIKTDVVILKAMLTVGRIAMVRPLVLKICCEPKLCDQSFAPQMPQNYNFQGTIIEFIIIIVMFLQYSLRMNFTVANTFPNKYYMNE